jgi:ABC-type transport system involved in multi-copper enzyme maturation permease subunit
MLWIVVKRELLDHVMSFRFSAMFVLTFLLMITSVLVFSAHYERARKEYPQRVEGFVDKDGKVQLGWIACQGGCVVCEVPSPLGFIFAAGEQDLPDQAIMAVHGVGSLQKGVEPGDIMNSPGGTDWTYVITVLLSFGAGLLTYKSISGERRDGTLTLVLANPVSRATILLGKYLAAVLALATVFIVSLIAGVLLLEILGTVPLGADDWIKILLFGILGVIFLSVFVFTGLLCSVFSRGPVLSAVAFLFAWMTLIFVIPNLGGILAGLTGSARTPRQVREAAREIPDRYTLTSAMSANQVASVKLQRESAREELLLSYLRSLMEQVDFGRELTSVSPASLFTTAAERIVGGGTFRLTHFVDNAVRYRQGFLQAIIDADKADPKSEHRYVPWWCGGNHFSMMTVDPGPAKVFRDTLPSAWEGAAAAFWDVFLLLIYTIIAFAVAFWRFARQDVAPAPGT